MTSLKHFQPEPQDLELTLYRVQLSTPHGKRWVSKYAISRQAVKFRLESRRVHVLQVLEA